MQDLGIQVHLNSGIRVHLKSLRIIELKKIMGQSVLLATGQGRWPTHEDQPGLGKGITLSIKRLPLSNTLRQSQRASSHTLHLEIVGEFAMSPATIGIGFITECAVVFFVAVQCKFCWCCDCLQAVATRIDLAVASLT